MRDLVDPMSFSVFTLAGCSMPSTGYRTRRVPDVRWEALDARNRDERADDARDARAKHQAR